MDQIFVRSFDAMLEVKTFAINYPRMYLRTVSGYERKSQK